MNQEQEQRTIFYSWQSDNRQSKNFIEKCLKQAIDSLDDNPALDYRPVLDDSTKGRLGAVELPKTIMEKIDACDIFVADLSFIGEYNGRKLVNQNVLYELGYMIGKRTANRVVMLFNSDFGEIKELPFDISHRRVMQFSVKNDGKGKQLVSNLTNLFSAYLQNAELWEQLPKNDEVELDNEELDIMKFFKSMDKDKHIMVVNTLDGSFIHPASSLYDEDLLSKINSEQGAQKLIANLDGLVDKNILKYYMGGANTPNYTLKKLGYNIIEKMQP